MRLILRRGLSSHPLKFHFINQSLASCLHPIPYLTKSKQLSDGRPPEEFYSPHLHANIRSLDWKDQEPTRLILLRKLEENLKCCQLAESWVTFNDFNKLYGYPDGKTIGKLLTELSYSCEPHWVRQARDLALVISVQKPGLLGLEILGKLALTFARSQMPKSASVMIRVALGRGKLPPLNVLQLVFLYLVKSEVGACLASNLLVEICGCVVGFGEKGRGGCGKAVSLDVILFNLVLDACIRFNEPIKGQAMVELMAQAAVVADAHSILLIGQVHEMNGQRDGIKMLRYYVDKVSPRLVCHYGPFYDSLLSLHFKFGDLDAAAELLVYLSGFQEWIPSQTFFKDLEKNFLVPVGSHNLKDGLKLRIAPQLVQKEFVLTVGQKHGLLSHKNGKLLPSNRALAQLILGYNKQGRTADLSKFLLRIQEGFNMQMGSCLCSDVISACISLGWLENAHDILDEVEAAGLSVSPCTCEALLKAYRERNMLKEADALVRQMRKIGLLVNWQNISVTSICPSQAPLTAARANLGYNLSQKMREEENTLPSIIFEWNSSIYFFCKAKMMGDASTIYRRMQEMKVQPTGQTFAYLAQGYSSLGKFRDITILWGDMKRNIESGYLAVGRDIYEFLLLHFIRGGYFERVMEVISFMEERNMFVDKLMFRDEFLKLHKNLYRNLKESEARTEAQSKRLGYVRMFRKWAGIR